MLRNYPNVVTKYEHEMLFKNKKLLYKAVKQQNTGNEIFQVN